MDRITIYHGSEAIVEKPIYVQVPTKPKQIVKDKVVEKKNLC